MAKSTASDVTSIGGRRGHLTAEQEDKLQELWEALFGALGIYEMHGRPHLSPYSAELTTVDSHHAFNLRFRAPHDNDDERVSPIASDYTVVETFTQTSPSELRRAFWTSVKIAHPDAFLLCYLRARKWDVQRALIMLLRMLRWRSVEVHLDDQIMREGEEHAANAGTTEGEVFMAQLRMGKSFLHGCDRDGRPICYIRARLHNKHAQTPASLQRYTLYNIETARLLVRPEDSKDRDGPVADNATLIFDLTDFSTANMDYNPILYMIKTFEANYPESLGRIIVYNAPWLFSGIWAILRAWLDPVVASKIQFCKTATDLSKFIPFGQIPTDMGGAENWEYSYTEPVPGENEKLKDDARREELQWGRECLAQRFEEATMDAAGESGSVELDDWRDEVAGRLRANYWDLDPFVRARSVYDRAGVLRGAEPVQFYPGQ